MSRQKATVWGGILGSMALGFLVFSPVMKASDSTEVSKLLSEAKMQAFALKEDAATMETFSRQDVGRETLAATISQIRESINAVGRELAKLDAVRDSAAPWQKMAIDQMRPLLRELAANTKAVMELINKNPQQINSLEYKDYLEANADEATQLAALIGDFVDYGRTKQRLERLTNKREIPPTGTF
jgi:hypothetical protein